MTKTVPAPAVAVRSATPKQQVSRWFRDNGWSPFRFQRQAWNAYLAGESGLIHASTGTGKTYAAWIGPILEWLADKRSDGPQKNQSPHRTGADKTPLLRVLWITPLRALAADTQQALQRPLDALGIPWLVQSRTGDTAGGTRRRQLRRLPTALITTPESLSILLSRRDMQQQFQELRMVVVDEWHELLGTKRGVQTELALARLRRWRPDLRTWGLSATLGNLEQARATLLGRDGATRISAAVATHLSDDKDSAPKLPSRLVTGAPPKRYVVDSLIPQQIERFPWGGHLGLKMVPQVSDALEEVDTSLVFTNTRAQCENWYRGRPALALRKRLKDYHG